MRKNIGFRKFVDEIRKTFRVHADESVKTLYENTFVNFESSLSDYSAVIENDKIKLQLKKYSYNFPENKPLLFYRVTAEFNTNIYYNAFLRLNFNDENQSRTFFKKVAKLIKEYCEISEKQKMGDSENK